MWNVFPYIRIRARIGSITKTDDSRQLGVREMQFKVQNQHALTIFRTIAPISTGRTPLVVGS